MLSASVNFKTLFVALSAPPLEIKFKIPIDFSTFNSSIVRPCASLIRVSISNQRLAVVEVESNVDADSKK